MSKSDIKISGFVMEAFQFLNPVCGCCFGFLVFCSSLIVPFSMQLHVCMFVCVWLCVSAVFFGGVVVLKVDIQRR